jgi:cysteinyl-tRNA synthetase
MLVHPPALNSLQLYLLVEYVDNVGDVDDMITRDLERQRLLSLLSEL